jgi:uncharacterized protein (TIGR01777 family)
MRVVIPGGSGHLGTLVAEALHGRGDEVIVVTRKPNAQPWQTAGWDELASVIDGADAVLNLAGRSVDCRYSAANRSAIMTSRVDTTRRVGEAIARARRAPAVWLQASTATIYAHRYDAANDEATGVLGGQEPDAPPQWHFSIDVAKAWEYALNEAVTPSTRKVALRTAMVMSPDPGGAFVNFRMVVRLGCGRMGDGRQWVSWIHHHDFVRAIEWLIDRQDIAGVVNVAAPNPLPNAEFLCAIRRACDGLPFSIPAPQSLLEVAAFIHRTETELLLKSRRVVPSRLLREGFTFQHPTWPEAARDLCHAGGREW